MLSVTLLLFCLACEQQQTEVATEQLTGNPEQLKQESGDLAIGLEWRPINVNIKPGESSTVGLYAVLQSGTPATISGLEMAFNWEAEYLNVIGLDQQGATPSYRSLFPEFAPCDLNELVPPEDGDGWYRWLAVPWNPPEVSEEGVLLTSFEIQGLQGRVEPLDFTIANEIGGCMTELISGLGDVLGTVEILSVTIGCEEDADCEDPGICGPDGRCKECRFSEDCPDDGVFCNGDEICDEGFCVSEGLPCIDMEHCDEVNQRCLECVSADECDDQDPCTYSLCDAGVCVYESAVAGSNDFDGDGNVDLDDYASFEQCMVGLCLESACSPPLYDQIQDVCCMIGDSGDIPDGDIDLEDFAEFQGMFGTP